MKRLLSMLLCVLTLISCFSFALADEDFSLRNGIHFGDTIDDVVAKETTLVRNDENSDSFTGKVAGYDGVECTFRFDINGKLVSMSYSFPSDVCSSKEGMDDIYSTIYQSLRRQYDAPLGNSGGTCYLITGPAFTNMSMWVYLLGAMDGCSADYTDYDEWIVESDGYNVKIDMVSFYFRDSDYNYKYMVDVSYYQFTDEDLENAVQEQRGQQEEIDNDF